MRELSSQSFGAVGRKTGMGYSALRGVVNRAEVGVYWEEIVRGAGDEGIYLGMDEHSFRGHRMVGTITEVRQRRILGIVKDDRQKTMRRYLEGLPEQVKQKVREVAIDMSEKMRVVVEKELEGPR